MWLNFRFDMTAERVYWAQDSAAVTGVNRVSIETPPAWEDAPEKFVALGALYICETCKPENKIGGQVRLPGNPSDGPRWAGNHNYVDCWGYEANHASAVFPLQANEFLPEP